MTSDITIGNYSSIKPNAVKWKCGVSNFMDSCSIKLPLITSTKTLLTGTDDLTNKKGSIPIFAEGDKVEVLLGYDGVNTPRFKGFVNRINLSTPLEIECEGYAYLLKKVIFTKSYAKTTAKEIIKDLIAGTEIKISEACQDFALTGVSFKKAPGVKVLEWLQKECLCTVFFDFDTLYFGASKFGIPKPTQYLQLGWNTADDKELKKAVQQTDTIINLVEKNSKGEVKKTKSDAVKYSQVKEVKVRDGMPEAFLKTLAAELQNEANFKHYNGIIKCFLVPHFEKGCVANVTNNRFPDREGSYFVEDIDGSFDSQGGRQSIKVRYYGTK